MPEPQDAVPALQARQLDAGLGGLLEQKNSVFTAYFDRPDTSPSTCVHATEIRRSTMPAILCKPRVCSRTYLRRIRTDWIAWTRTPIFCASTRLHFACCVCVCVRSFLFVRNATKSPACTGTFSIKRPSSAAWRTALCKQTSALVILAWHMCLT